MEGAAGHQPCWLVDVNTEMWGGFAARLKWGQLVCEVEAERSAFMVTRGDLGFRNRIDWNAGKRRSDTIYSSASGAPKPEAL